MIVPFERAGLQAATATRQQKNLSQADERARTDFPEVGVPSLVGCEKLVPPDEPRQSAERPWLARVIACCRSVIGERGGVVYSVRLVGKTFPGLLLVRVSTSRC
ncbi:MAG: hypothetical protein VB859_01450 [Planctomycetaceae bacterium]